MSRMKSPRSGEVDSWVLTSRRLPTQRFGLAKTVPDLRVGAEKMGLDRTEAYEIARPTSAPKPKVMAAAKRPSST